MHTYAEESISSGPVISALSLCLLQHAEVRQARLQQTPMSLVHLATCTLPSHIPPPPPPPPPPPTPTHTGAGATHEYAEVNRLCDLGMLMATAVTHVMSEQVVKRCCIDRCYVEEVLHFPEKCRVHVASTNGSTNCWETIYTCTTSAPAARLNFHTTD